MFVWLGWLFVCLIWLIDWSIAWFAIAWMHAWMNQWVNNGTCVNKEKSNEWTIIQRIVWVSVPLDSVSHLDSESVSFPTSILQEATLSWRQQNIVQTWLSACASPCKTGYGSNWHRRRSSVDVLDTQKGGRKIAAVTGTKPLLLLLLLLPLPLPATLLVFSCDLYLKPPLPCSTSGQEWSKWLG